jgi:hypothetical protein
VIFGQGKIQCSIYVDIQFPKGKIILSSLWEIFYFLTVTPFFPLLMRLLVFYKKAFSTATLKDIPLYFFLIIWVLFFIIAYTFKLIFIYRVG